MDKLTISRILVENKYLLPVTKADTGVHVVDIPKAAEVLNELFQQKLKQCNVSSSAFFKVKFLYDKQKQGRRVWHEDLRIFDAVDADELHKKINDYINSDWQGYRYDMHMADVSRM